MNEELVATETWRVTPDPMCILDVSGRFVAVNPAWRATLGWTREQMVGQPYLDFLHPDDFERSMEAFEEVKRGNPVLRFENRYRAKDGSYRWLSWVAVPEGQHFYCTTRDVTEDKARAETIASQREEADLREQFLAILGHDLRNPLGSFVSGVRLLSREPQSDRSNRVLQGMRASTARMSELINNMMDFARVRLGDGIGLDRRPQSDLAAQISQVIDEIEHAFPGARITLSAELTRDVTCDAPRVMQVLSNLLGNAVTHGTEDETIEVAASNTADRLQLSVSNKGELITDAARENLFRPFFKGDPHASPQGLGLGLYISAEIAAAHGGRLDVVSDARDTRFILDIPA